MNPSIELSRKTQNLLAKSKKHLPIAALPRLSNDELKRADYAAWLTQAMPCELSLEQQTLLAKVELALLKAYSKSTAPRSSLKVGLFKRVLFIFSCLIGSAFSAYSSAQGIKGILALFFTPGLLITIPLVICSILSMFAFTGMAVMQASATNGILAKKVELHVDDLIELREQLEQRLKKLLTSLTQLKSKQAFLEAKLEWAILQANTVRLNRHIQQLPSSPGSEIKKSKRFLHYLRAVFFAASGFFIGQTAALYFLGGLSVAAAMSNPMTASIMLGVGILAALAYTAFYCFVQGGETSQAIEKVMGYDREKIKNLKSTKASQQIDNTLNVHAKLLARLELGLAHDDAGTQENQVEPVGQAIDKEGAPGSTPSGLFDLGFFPQSSADEIEIAPAQPLATAFPGRV